MAKGKNKGPDKYWLNGEGYYDPTAAQVIEHENHDKKSSVVYTRARDKAVGNLIDGIKAILRGFDLELVDRIKIRDKTTGKEYL